MSKLASVILTGLGGITALLGLTTFPTDSIASLSVKTASTCVVLRGAGPGYNASIGNQQIGKTVCVTVGEKLLVVLSAPSANGTPWRAVRVSKVGILKIAPLTLMFSRGTTGTNFEAVRAGTVRLTSQRSACAAGSSGTPVCGAIELWEATLVVTASQMAPRVPSGTGVYGFVTAGPTCPVEQVGRPCPPTPTVAEMVVRDAGGQMIASAQTDRLGRYAISVKPGRYVLAAVTSGTFPNCPSEVVTVTSGSPLRADISCDTGIR